MALLRLRRPDHPGPGRRPGADQGPEKPPRGSNVFWGKLKALARPYPQAIAGTPIRWSFDPATRKFELVYTTKRADGHGRFERGTTKVFVPKIQYPDGFRVRVTGGLDCQRRGKQRLLADRTAPTASS